MNAAQPLTRLAWLGVGVGAAALALTGCGRKDESVGQKIDATVQKAEQKAGEIKEDIKAGAQSAGTEVRKAADAAGDAVKDAAITAAVNAELARDATLSALKINVDTSDGKVLLKGEAPSSDARSRATTLATGVQGVKSVDNQLTIVPKS